MNAAPLPWISHVEWCVTDLDRSQTFLEQLFGWHFEPYSTHFRLCDPGQGPMIGLLQVERLQPVKDVLLHICVEDLHQAIERAQQLGAALHTPPTEAVGHGRYAHVLDPDAHVIGLFESMHD